MFIKYKKVFNEMGDGWDEYMVMQDSGGIRLVHVGRFYNDMMSTTDTTGMDKKGYKNG